MKRTYTLLSILLIIVLSTTVSLDAFAGKKKVQLSVSETDAEIYIDGKLMGKGNTEVLILTIQHLYCIVVTSLIEEMKNKWAYDELG